MKIKYIGLKPQSSAFKAETGITWLPGESHEIKDVVAAKMLKHPDVFAVDEKAAEVPKAADPGVRDIDPVNVELLAMTRDELKERAKSLGLDIHHNAGVSTLIKAIQAAEVPKAAE